MSKRKSLPAPADMDDGIPIIVRVRVNCARCGHHEDETYEFDMPADDADPLEEYAPGKCPECRAPIQVHLQRRQQVQ